MFNCGYCGKEFKTLSERCKCEVECGKKQMEEVRLNKQKELARIKKDRDDEITNATKCLANQINAFYADYHERCSAENPSVYDSIYDYIKVMNLICNSYIS